MHPKPILTADKDGADIALVFVKHGSKPAKLLRQDFDTLIEAGFIDHWTLNKGRVVGYSQAIGNAHGIARAIMQAPAGKLVMYRDRDPLNLRRDNLFIPIRKRPRMPAHAR